MLPILLTSLLLGASPAKPAAAPFSSPADSAAPGSAVRSVPSPDSLVAAILSALNAKDLRRLDALSFNKREFLEVYPFFETDTSEDRRGFATGFYLRDNQKTLDRRMNEEGGRNVVLSRYDIDGPLTTYGPAILYRGFRIWVKDGDGEREIRLVKSAAQFHGGWKIWSFSDN